MSGSLLLDPLYHMVQQVNADGLLLHAYKIMELESVIAIIITVKIPLNRHPRYKGKHNLNSGLPQYREHFCYITSSKNKGNLETERLLCNPEMQLSV